MWAKGKRVLKMAAVITVGAVTAVLVDRILTPKVVYWCYKHGYKEYKGENGECPYDFCDECLGCGTHAKEER